MKKFIFLVSLFFSFSVNASSIYGYDGLYSVSKSLFKQTGYAIIVHERYSDNALIIFIETHENGISGDVISVYFDNTNYESFDSNGEPFGSGFEFSSDDNAINGDKFTGKTLIGDTNTILHGSFSNSIQKKEGVIIIDSCSKKNDLAACKYNTGEILTLKRIY
ncbi:MAG: hypothetical protein QM500_07105 [Methylococcales bacterium]